MRKERSVMKLQDTFSKAIEIAIFRKQITRESLAKQIGVTPNTLYRKLNGMRPFKLDEIESIANTLGFINIWDFLDFVKEEEQSARKMPAGATTGTTALKEIS